MALGIGSAIATVGAFLNTQKAISDGADAKTVMLDFLNTVESKQFGLAKTQGSITKLLKPYIVEPIIITTDTCRSIEVFDKVLQLNTDIFASFYLQAFKILSDQFEMPLDMTIQILSTDNTSLTSTSKKALIKALSREEANVPNFLQAVLSQEDQYLRLSHEAGWFKKLFSGLTSSGQPETLDEAEQLSRIKLNETLSKQAKANAAAADRANLNDGPIDKGTRVDFKSSFKDLEIDKDPLYGSLIRTLELQYVQRLTKQILVMPITIKAHVIISDIHNILGMLAPNSRDKKFVNRLDEWRAGAISFWDLIACNDLIADYKKNKLKDKDDLLSVINARAKGSALTAANTALTSGGKTGVEGFEKNYNMLVVSADEKVRLDRHIGGDISKEKYKQELLEQAHAMLCTVLDQDYERANILTKDIRGVSDIGFKALGRRKDKDNDMAGILQSLLTAKPIGF